MAKTNIGLLEYAKHFIGFPYWYGCYGQTATAGLYTQMKALYPSYYTATDFTGQYGKKVHDCSGLIKGYIWCDTVDGVPTYKASQDCNAQMLYNNASEKGTIGSIQAVAGLLVFKGTSGNITHVGVYGNDGYVYEAKSHSSGVQKTAFNSGSWSYWAKCHLIDYGTDSSVASGATGAVNDEVKASTYPSGFNAEYSKTWIVNTQSSGLNIRDGASTAYNVLVSIPKGTSVRCWGYFEKVASGDIWLYVQFTYNGIVYTGFASKTYLK